MSDEIKNQGEGASPGNGGGEKSPVGFRIPEEALTKEHEKIASPWFVVGGFVILMIILVIAQFGKFEQEEATGWVVHTAEVQTEIRELLSELQDAETGQRGYIITGDEIYLTPYDTAINQAATALEELRELTIDNPRQQARIDLIEGLIQEKFNELAQSIDVRREEGVEAAIAIVRSDLGKAIMDTIRLHINAMLSAEEELTISRQERTELIGLFINVFQVLGLLGMIGVGYMAFRQIKSSADGQRKARLQLVEYNEALEDIIAQRTGDLMRSNEELEQFAYVASHDLRSPLRAIDNLSEWIEEDLGNKLKGQTKENLTTLRGRVKRLEALLDDILAYSRAGRQDRKIKEVDVAELIEEVKSFQNIPKGFKVEVKGDLPTVRAPVGALDQIFSNLINNALKHHDKKVGTITISCKDREEGWEFSVKDDGPGIAPEFKERVFRMFQKLEGRDQAEGSGMGLAIIRKLVEAQGGKVTFDSNPDSRRGTTFRFTWRMVQTGI